MPHWLPQIGDDTSTAIPGAGHDYIKLLSETVNPANGSVGTRFSVPMPQGRSLTLPFGFAYDTNGVNHLMGSGNGSARWQSNTGYLAQGGWSYSVPLLSQRGWSVTIKGTGTNGASLTCSYNSDYVFYDPNATRHSLGLGIASVVYDNTGFEVCDPSHLNGGDPQLSATLHPSFPGDPSAPATISDSDGTIFYFSNPQNHFVSGFFSLSSFVQDRNGNKINITDSGNGVFTITDTLGRTSVSSSGFGPSGSTNTVSVSGSSAPYQITWQTVSANYAVPSTAVSADPLCGPVPNVSTTLVVVQSITLPNGQKYQFYYDPTYGLLSQIVYPTGAWVKYTWKPSDQKSELAIYPDSNGNPNGCVFQYAPPVVATRQVSFDGSSSPVLTQSFTYTTTWRSDGYTWTQKTTKVTTTDNRLGKSAQTLYTYGPFFAGTQPYENPPLIAAQIPVEQTIQYFDWGNTTTPIRTVNKNWFSIFDIQSEQTVLDNGLSSKVTYCYVGPSCTPNFVLSQLQETDEYDYGATSPSRKTVTSWQSFPTTSNAIADKPCQTIVYDNSGTRVAETDYLYDGGTTVCGTPGTPSVAQVSNLPTGTHDETNYGPASTTPRGNATTVTRQCFQGTQTCTNPVTTFTYDETGQVLSMKDPNGNTTNYSYADNFDSNPSSSTNAYVTQITAPPTNGVSHIQKFKYAYSDGQPIQSTDQNNQVTSYFYVDPLRRLTETDYPDGGKTTISYNDAPASPSVTTTKKINSTQNLMSSSTMDGLGHVVKTLLTSDPDCLSGDRTDTTYDGLGTVRTVSNPYCTTADPTYGLTTYTYDALGRTTNVIPPDGTTSANNVTTVYLGNCTTVTDQAGKARKTCTDGLGRLVEADEPTSFGGGTPGQGSVTITGSERTVQGPPYSCGYHGQDTCYPTIPDTGAVSITVNGFTKSVSHGFGSTSSSLASALASALNADPASPVSVSASSNVVTLTAKVTGAGTNYSLSASSVTQNTTYFPAGSTSFPVSVSGPYLNGGSDVSFTNPFVTLYAYDALNNLLTVTQKGGSTDSTQWRNRTFAYDSLSRLTSSTNPESNTVPSTGATLATTYVYDANGNLSSKTSPAPNQTSAATVTLSYCYDALNRITSKAYTAQSCPMTSPTASYFYDQISYNGLTIANGIGRRTGMSDAAGAEAWSYDAMGRVLTDRRTTNGVTKNTTYAYSPYLDGSINTITYPSGRIMTYSTGTAERSLSAVDNSTGVSYAASAHYTPSGALSSLANGASLASTLFYNSRLQPCRISVKSSGTAPTTCTSTAVGNVLDLTYSFNLGSANNGNVASITNNRDNTRSQNFTYDSLNRISTAQTQTTGVTIPNTNCWGLTFSYDPWGNLLQSSTTGPAGCGEPLPLNVTVTTANRISGYCYDTSGNMLDQATCPAPPHAYTYNAENQLTSAGGVTYSYDGDGRRVQKSSGKIYWYGMGSDALDETDLAGNTSNSSFNEYVFFNGKRIARRDYLNNVNYYFADHLGTARVVTNASGTVLDDSDFYPFGGERVTTSSSGNTYKFTGKERDSESGLDNFGARYDSSNLGRFMTPDEIGEGQHPTNPQSWNLYSYVQNNPINSIDPDGHDCVYLDNNGGTNPNGPGGASIDHNSSQKECDKTGGRWANGTVEELRWVRADPESDTVHIFSHYRDVVGQTWAGPGWSHGDKYADMISPEKILDMQDRMIDTWLVWAILASHTPGVPQDEEEEARGYPVGSRRFVLDMGPDESGERLPPTNRGGMVGGRMYSGHAFDGMQEAGLTPTVVEEVIAVGTPSAGRSPGTTAHTTQGITVVTNPTGKVVTVFYTRK